MKYVLALWAVPMSLFWGWYLLSSNDMNFGFLFLSREVHDFAFGIYGSLLGLDPAEIPGLAARACALDTLLIGAILTFRRRHQIAAWWKGDVAAVS